MICHFIFPENSLCSNDLIDLNTADINNRNIILTECGLLPKLFHNVYICSTHFTFLLKRNSDVHRRKTCQVPFFINSHESHPSSSITKKQKCSRSLTISDILKIHRGYGPVLPIGTRKYSYNLRYIYDILIHKCTMIYNGNEYAFILTLLNNMRLIMILKYDDDKDLKIVDYLFFY